MAVVDVKFSYDHYLQKLAESVGLDNTEAVSKKKQELKTEIKKSVQSEVQKVVANMLRVLYDSDYEKLYADIAKIALIGTKDNYSNIEKIAVLSLIWGSVSEYYGDSLEEFKVRINNPVWGLLL